MKLYFLNQDSDYCYPLSYFRNYLKENHLKTIELIEATPDKTKKFFFCKYHMVNGIRQTNTCGKICEYYKPRNNKNGCCRYYVNTYEKSNREIII